MATHYFVKGDTGSQLKVTLVRNDTGAAINCLTATVYLRIRKRGNSTIICSILGTVPDVTKPNEVAFVLGTNLSTLEGLYEGEIEVFSGGLSETVYELINIQVRAGF